MEKVLEFVGLTFLAAITVSCNSSAAPPSCSDEVVKSVVIEISEKEFVSQLFKNELNQFGAYPASILGQFSIETWKTNPPDPKQTANFDFEVKDIQDKISEVEVQVAGLAMQLTAIRVMGQDDKIKKSSCGGNLSLSNGRDVPITYSAQTTEDGQVYVEVQGL